MKHAKYTKKSDSYLQTGFAFGNLYKTTKEELNAIGAASGGAISSIQLARWMAELLLRETGGEELGDSKRVSKMRRGPTARGVVVAAEAVDVRSYGRRSLKKRSKGGPAAYWAAMTPAERSIEMQRRMAKRKAA